MSTSKIFEKKNQKVNLQHQLFSCHAIENTHIENYFNKTKLSNFKTNTKNMSFYNYITEKRKDTDELKRVMDSVTTDLIKYNTDEIKPGILLGLIQSGKTRAFLGVMAKCFDNSYDISVILTKNSVALVAQTLKRLRSEFDVPISAKKLYVWDVIKLQNLDQLTGYILQNKVIFVVKKEMNNMIKLHQIFDEAPQLMNKNVLIIDDEADQASISFVNDKTKADGIDFAKIASLLSEFRLKLKGRNSFLQVTATPYSLYLQPEDLNLNQEETAPNRPTFTHLLHPHQKYVGGKYYFEDSINSNSTAYYIFNQVQNDQIANLNTKSKTSNTYNKKALNNILKTDSFRSIREAIIKYLVGGCIRQIQQRDDSNPWNETYHSAFVLHTAPSTAIHTQQKNLIENIIEKLNELSLENLEIILNDAYLQLCSSLQLIDIKIPTINEVVINIKEVLEKSYVGITVVNSEQQVVELLGEDGQLRLDNPFNIFIGGQTLDRGITIDHLIGFYYGRNPKSFQMDTVLQHSRMYGSRSVEDLAVTRFYTTNRVYEAMRNMHFFDQDLRENILKDTNASVRFIAKQGSTIKPCGPNKIKASSILSFKEYSRFLPIGIQTKSKSNIQKIISEIDNLLSPLLNKSGEGIIDFEKLKIILEKINSTYTFEPQFGNVGLSWDLNIVLKAIELAQDFKKSKDIGIYFRENRETSRTKDNDQSFTDAPDDGKTDLPRARQLATDKPVVMFLKQRGSASKGWRDTEFYWPVVLMPSNMPNYVYSED